MIGDSFDGWIETFRTQAAAERMRGRYVECNRRNRGLRPSALTISSWYLSTGQTVSGCGKGDLPSLARLRRANAAWHWTFKLELSIKLTRD
jgi:hypothetical protein